MVSSVAPLGVITPMRGRRTRGDVGEHWVWLCREGIERTVRQNGSSHSMTPEDNHLLGLGVIDELSRGRLGG